MKLNINGFGLALASTWAIFIVVTGLLAHFTGVGTSFIQHIDSMYPGAGTGPRGILIVMIFGILQGYISGILIAGIYNAYVSTLD